MSVKLEKSTKSEQSQIKICFFVFGLCFFASACSTNYENTAIKSWSSLGSNHVDNAISEYEKNVKSPKDRLLKLMDQAILFRSANRFEESNQKLFEASEIIELAGYVNVAEQAVTLVSNEKQTVYQGEDFEKVLVHVYLALNFISLEQWSEALVEARRVNEILMLMVQEGKRPYQQNAFARYLSASVYERTREVNSAFIDYKKTLEILPGLEKVYPQIAIDLLRACQLLGFENELKDYQKQFGERLTEQARQSLKENQAQVIVLFESGKSPQKYSSRETHSKKQKGGSLVEVIVPVAYYKERASLIKRLRIEADHQSSMSVTLNDIEQTAMRHLQDRMGRAIGKALLTAGVKAGIATGIGVASKSEDLGLLAGLLLFAASEADTRSWLLLPEKLQVAKLFLPLDTKDLRLEYLDIAGHIIRTEEIQNLQLKKNEVRILQRRSYE